MVIAQVMVEALKYLQIIQKRKYSLYSNVKHKLGNGSEVSLI